jgi:signal transduction histidine kinase/DNA-binding response OmpR family regulator
MRRVTAGVLAGFLIPVFVAFCAASLVTFRASENLAQSRALVEHTYEVIDTSRALLSFAQDAETGQRGYLITGEDSYLAPYRTAVEAIPKQLERLKALVSDNPSQRDRIDALEMLIGARLAALRSGLDAFHAEGLPAARQILLRGMGTTAMEEIRRVLGEFKAEENGLLTVRLSNSVSAQRLNFMATLIGSACALFGLLGAAYLLHRNVRSLGAAEQALAQQASFLQVTLDNVREGIAAFDSKGALIAWNKGFMRILDFPDTLARVNEPLASFIAEDRRRPEPAIDALVAHSPETGSFICTDKLLQLRRGDRDVEIYCSGLASGGFVITASDITRRLQSEAIIRQSQKMEAIGHLTGGVAHDFNNLLQVINTNLDLLEPVIRGDAKATQRLQSAVAGAERGARLTRQLLAFARRQPLEPKVINFGRMIADMSDMLRRTLGETYEIETIVGAGLWNTLADRHQIENAVLNLAINARDAMPNGGKLTIELSNAFLDENYAARHAEVSPGQYVMLAVADTGVGMDANVVTRAFEPFFTTKPEGQGTGLGLSMVYGFVKQSGGHVKIYSERGQGTAVKLYLPRVRRPEDEVEDLAAGSVIGGHETILVVEDDAGVRHAAIDMLGELGYRTIEAENADAALEIALSGKPIDLLFTDVVTPSDISTREMARRAQAALPNLAILYTSGYTENAVIHHGRLDEGVSLLSKPYKRDELARKIRAVLAAPRSVPRPAAGVSPAADGVALRRGLKLLIVEDDPLVRLGAADLAQELGCIVVEAPTGQAALDAIAEDPDIEVMMTDLGLPGMSGGELIVAARRRRPDLGVVIASGSDRDAAKNIASAGQIFYLAKPYELTAFERVLLTIQNGGPGGTPQ